MDSQDDDLRNPRQVAYWRRSSAATFLALLAFGAILHASNQSWLIPVLLLPAAIGFGAYVWIGFRCRNLLISAFGLLHLPILVYALILLVQS